MKVSNATFAILCASKFFIIVWNVQCNASTSNFNRRLVVYRNKATQVRDFWTLDIYLHTQTLSDLQFPNTVMKDTVG